jgi:hypothetical protein
VIAKNEEYIIEKVLCHHLTGQYIVVVGDRRWTLPVRAIPVERLPDEAPRPGGKLTIKWLSSDEYELYINDRRWYPPPGDGADEQQTRGAK